MSGPEDLWSNAHACEAHMASSRSDTHNLSCRSCAHLPSSLSPPIPPHTHRRSTAPLIAYYKQRGVLRDFQVKKGIKDAPALAKAMLAENVKI
jgi:hypothetical protein